MRDIRLFRASKGKMEELEIKTFSSEDEINNLIRNNISDLFAVKIITTEYSTGLVDNGSIDILAMDENNCPVIILYKDYDNENLITKGIYYLDWLLDHQGDYETLVIKSLGQEILQKINWSQLRLLCIANSFSKYDIHSANRFKRNIELFKYRSYDDIIYFEFINVIQERLEYKSDNMLKNYSIIKKMNDKVLKNFLDLRELISDIGNDIKEVYLTDYIAYKTLRNFMVITYNESFRKDSLIINLKLDLKNELIDGDFIRNVSKIDHIGNGNIEINIKTPGEVLKAIKYIELSYYKN